ncbi:MAG TPA: cobyric acid synthase [Alphaproteobacteria bacterium]|nr:cobyric acid synthase [Alphaproteobacteria bacterium]MDP6270309.1 cobyric acid synthase [Alphaproteobacteria bacterium]MDP7164450.1 cobyric acid synthase [Alphaproteobacteria bacterium]MDP7426813.1 cobyric acid synthase [Alphaproteobacteria bacterium]HJM52121.1 cobyric acid synthase [Alphaproteobacteria bacterium]
MLQGTGSDVGKSLLAAALCRIYARQGLSVRPFKPQNMSNNAAVTADGGEIGRAQALQARAAGVAPASDMNPVLLKPESETGAQVVVQGKMWRRAAARDYQALKPELLGKVLESFERLGRGADLVVIEGAGSPAEVNLRAGDIANMGFAEAADVPVVLVGDIDRGGVIAQIVGTQALLSKSERGRLGGYLVNKFRGDLSLFDDGIDIIGQRTGLESLGVVPYFPAAHRLPAEDAVALEGYRASEDRPIRIAVPQLSRIANFDDLDPLIAMPEVGLEMVRAGQAIPGDCQLVILPGSKSTRGDLEFLRHQGWDVDIRAHLRRGGTVLGICGGFQMLGTKVCDPDGIEGPAGETPGLGLLDFATVLGGDKALVEVTGVEQTSGQAVQGFRMHLGRSAGPALERPMVVIDGDGEGAVSLDGRVLGCYLHALFAADGFRAAFLGRLAGRQVGAMAFDDEVETVLDDLADHVAAHAATERILEVARGR